MHEMRPDGGFSPTEFYMPMAVRPLPYSPRRHATIHTVQEQESRTVPNTNVLANPPPGPYNAPVPPQTPFNSPHSRPQTIRLPQHHKRELASVW